MAEQNKSIVLGGGCFWCLEASYQLIKGVVEVIPGYSGGETENPNYEQVCKGIGGHAEVVKINYDPGIIDLSQILDVFWLIHDPTSTNRQGNDVGVQYRSCIYYGDDDLNTINQSVRDIESILGKKIATEIAPLKKFYPAEEYHQNYFQKNPQAGYCQAIINPKLEHLRLSLSDLLQSY